MTTTKKPVKKVPAGVKKPQDHARKAEATGEEFATLNVRGVEMTVTRDQREWPLAALDAFAEDQHLRGIKFLLGAEQWAALLAAGATAGDLDTLGEQFAEQFGIDAGN